MRVSLSHHKAEGLVGNGSEALHLCRGRVQRRRCLNRNQATTSAKHTSWPRVSSHKVSLAATVTPEPAAQVPAIGMAGPLKFMTEAEILLALVEEYDAGESGANN